MADSKITALTSIGASTDPANDPLVLVDVSDTSMAASGTTKKVTLNQLLGASGTATLASATITGDLTVDTSTLKVDSANNRVGIGTASPVTGATLQCVGTSTISGGTGASAANGLHTWFDTGTNTGYISSFHSGVDNRDLRYDAKSHVWSLPAGTAMTLNSTGLGVGASPVPDCKLTVRGGSFFDRGASGGSPQLLLALAASSGGNYGQISNTGTRWALGFGSTLTTVGTESLIWDSSGNVGVGGTPTEKLSVNGSIGLQNGGTQRWHITATSGSDLVFTRSSVADRFTITSDGNVGVGVTPSAWVSTVKALDISSGGAVYAGSLNCGLAANYYLNSSGNYIYKTTAFAAGYVPNYANNGSHVWFNAPSGTAGNAITFTQAMTLDASGNLLVGTTGQLYAASGARLNVDSGTNGSATFKTSAGSGQANIYAFNSATTGDNAFISFGTEATFTSRGSITYNRAGGLVAYNTTSDYRAKDIVGPVLSSGSIIDSLKVYIGKMKGALVERPMLVAHEAQAVAPYSVTGQKDEVDADGNPKYQQMDVSSFVPLLIAEIQSLRTRVAALEA